MSNPIQASDGLEQTADDRTRHQPRYCNYFACHAYDAPKPCDYLANPDYAPTTPTTGFQDELNTLLNELVTAVLFPNATNDERRQSVSLAQAAITALVNRVIGDDEINDHEATEFMLARAKKIRNRRDIES